MNRKWCSLPVVVLSLVSLNAFAAGAAGLVPSPDKLRGGHEAKSSDPIAQTTVGLVFQTADGDTALCTGSIIADDLILTAAHCLEGSDPVIYFGTDLRNATTILQSDATMVPSGYVADPSGIERNDIGLVRFHGGLPAGYHPVTMLADASAIRKHAKMTIAGVGTNKVKGRNIRYGYLRVSHYRVVNPQYSSMEVKLRQRWFISSVCPGDSGGPAYVEKDGKYYLWGVANVIEGLMTPLTPCGTSSVYANVVSPELSSWLERAETQLRAVDCGSTDCSAAQQL